MAAVIQLASASTVAQMLEREDFRARFEGGHPISIVELLYPLLQGYDSVAVHADVELGGTDQTFNLLMGREVQRAYGQEPQVVLTLPLLEGIDGVRKMSKSSDNFVALTEPPAEQFGKLMSIPDELITKYELLCTDLGPEEVERARTGLADGSIHPNAEKRRMARLVVDLYHDAGAGAAAEAEFDAVFKDHDVPSDIREVALPPGVGEGQTLWLPKVLVAAGLASSNAEAKRHILGGAVRLEGQPVNDPDAEFGLEELRGKVLQVGRRRFVRLSG
jgi:tyrosyl-tRNA synthetase